MKKNSLATRNKTKSPGHPLDYSNPNPPARKNKKVFTDDVVIITNDFTVEEIFSSGSYLMSKRYREIFE